MKMLRSIRSYDISQSDAVYLDLSTQQDTIDQVMQYSM